MKWCLVRELCMEAFRRWKKDGLIHFIREEDKRKIYEITELGTEVLELELKRIRRLYRNAQEVTK